MPLFITWPIAYSTVAVGYDCAPFDISMTIGKRIVTERNLNLKLGMQNSIVIKSHTLRNTKICFAVYSNFCMIKCPFLSYAVRNYEGHINI